MTEVHQAQLIAALSDALEAAEREWSDETRVAVLARLGEAQRLATGAAE